MTVCTACGFAGEFDGPDHAYMSFSPACWARYGEILAREFSDQEYFKAHRLLVDAACGQHSVSEDRRARQSLHIHLAALMLDFEDGVEEAEIVSFLRKAAGGREFAALDMPEQNSAVTLAGVHGAVDAAQHSNEVKKYARGVFDVWAVHHPVFRALIQEVRV